MSETPRECKTSAPRRGANGESSFVQTPSSPCLDELTRSASRIDTTIALYTSLMGIHNAYAIGSPATAMMFEFGPPKADKGALRRLRIDLGADGRMSGAEVLHLEPDELCSRASDQTGIAVCRSFLTRRTIFKISCRRTCRRKTSGRWSKKSGLASAAERCINSPDAHSTPALLFDFRFVSLPVVTCGLALSRPSGVV